MNPIKMISVGDPRSLSRFRPVVARTVSFEEPLYATEAPRCGKPGVAYARARRLRRGTERAAFPCKADGHSDNGDHCIGDGARG